MKVSLGGQVVPTPTAVAMLIAVQIAPSPPRQIQGLTNAGKERGLGEGCRGRGVV